MPDDHSVSAPKTLKQRFGAQVGKFNNFYSDHGASDDRYTLTFDRSVENRINLHIGSPDDPAVASALFVSDAWTTNDGQQHRTLHDAAEHMIAIRAEPRGEIEGGDATEVQGHPKFLTPTGRMSLGQPEMQELSRLPMVQADPRIDTETLRSADFSDIEQRILAVMTFEQIDAFKRGEAVAVNIDGVTPGANACAEIITIGGGRGDDLFRGGYRRSAEIDRGTVVGAAEQGRRMHLGFGAGLALAGAAAVAGGLSAGRSYGYGHTMTDVTPRPQKAKKAKRKPSSYSPCKASVTGQHKGSGDAKKAAQNVKKAQKAAKRARRQAKQAKIDA